MRALDMSLRGDSCESDSALCRGESLQDRCLRYRQDLDLPAAVPPGARRIEVTLNPGAINSVIAPASLGHAAMSTLAAGLKGPAAEDMWSRRMLFLTAPDPAPTVLEIDRLVVLNVVVGGRVALLPTPWEERVGRRRWVCGPEGRCLPPTRDILDALLGVR